MIDSDQLFLTPTRWPGPSFMYRLFRQSERRYDWTANCGTFSEIMFLIFHVCSLDQVCVVSNKHTDAVTGLWFLRTSYTTVKWTHPAPRPPGHTSCPGKALIMTPVSELQRLRLPHLFYFWVSLMSQRGTYTVT